MTKVTVGPAMYIALEPHCEDLSVVTEEALIEWVHVYGRKHVAIDVMSD